MSTNHRTTLPIKKERKMLGEANRVKDLTGVLTKQQQLRLKSYYRHLKKSPQARADHATGTIIEAIQNIASALDDAAVAIMYNIPARGAEPDRSLYRLDSARKKLTRALYLTSEEVQRPDSKEALR
jgi:hypothetical protein